MQGVEKGGTGEMSVLISEIFRSRQGEGRLTGTESVFVRSSGCNLRCWFCDTPYTSWEPDGQPMPLAEIMRRVADLPSTHVVITGGEPMLTKGLAELCQAIHGLGKHITIETAGTIFQQVRCDLMSISPKLSNSTPAADRAGVWHQRHEAARHRPDVIRRLIESYDYQLKFVVDDPTDLSEIDRYLAEFPTVKPDHVWLMPQGIEVAALRQREAWLGPHCQSRGFHLCSRKQIDWYGNRRGT